MNESDKDKYEVVSQTAWRIVFILLFGNFYSNGISFVLSGDNSGYFMSALSACGLITQVIGILKTVGEVEL